LPVLECRLGTFENPDNPVLNLRLLDRAGLILKSNALSIAKGVDDLLASHTTAKFGLCVTMMTWRRSFAFLMHLTKILLMV
jgi:hypothetical protein